MEALQGDGVVGGCKVRLLQGDRRHTASKGSASVAAPERVALLSGLLLFPGLSSLCFLVYCCARVVQAEKEARREAKMAKHAATRRCMGTGENTPPSAMAVTNSALPVAVAVRTLVRRD